MALTIGFATDAQARPEPKRRSFTRHLARGCLRCTRRRISASLGTRYLQRCHRRALGKISFFFAAFSLPTSRSPPPRRHVHDAAGSSDSLFWTALEITALGGWDLMPSRPAYWARPRPPLSECPETPGATIRAQLQDVLDDIGRGNSPVWFPRGWLVAEPSVEPACRQRTASSKGTILPRRFCHAIDLPMPSASTRVAVRG